MHTYIHVLPSVAGSHLTTLSRVALISIISGRPEPGNPPAAVSGI